MIILQVKLFLVGMRMWENIDILWHCCCWFCSNSNSGGGSSSCGSSVVISNLWTPCLLCNKINIMNFDDQCKCSVQ